VGAERSVASVAWPQEEEEEEEEGGERCELQIEREK
jgi:hypothetical protein